MLQQLKQPIELVHGQDAAPDGPGGDAVAPDESPQEPYTKTPAQLPVDDVGGSTPAILPPLVSLVNLRPPVKLMPGDQRPLMDETDIVLDND